jgi:Fur family peroxide stress response transcriptional regulator
VHLPSELRGRLSAAGVRTTRQRENVLAVLWHRRDHPTATEVFFRAKKHMPSISLATVYNCLEALTESGLVKQVHLDRAPTRYCPNLLDHNHFFCVQCGAVHDVASGSQAWDLPPGFVVSHAEVALRGLCPKCSADSL